jgi:hypothetical protein
MSLVEIPQAPISSSSADMHVNRFTVSLTEKIIQGLLSRLPKSGDVWPETDRTLWLQLLEGSFKLIYKDKPLGEAAVK